MMGDEIVLVEILVASEVEVHVNWEQLKLLSFDNRTWLASELERIKARLECL